MSAPLSLCGVTVSIHAPGRGATPSNSNDNNNNGTVSIHAPGRGATLRRNIPIVGLCEFQFTHPGGVRLGSRPLASRPRRFNSRTREGCDWSSVRHVT